VKRIALAVIATAAAATAWAYLRPVDALLKDMATHRESLHFHSLVVYGQYTFYGDEAKAAASGFKVVDAADEVALSAELQYRLADAKLPGRCAITVHAPTGVAADSGTTSNNSSRVKVVGPELASLKAQAALGCPLLEGDALVLTSLLQYWGVETATVSLQRFSGIPFPNMVYAIGAKPRDLAKPQLWITKEFEKKEDISPVRIIARVDGKLYDVQLRDYMAHETNEWHPREIDIFESGKLLAKFVAQRVDDKVKISETLF
jgi:hypothetical protein